MTDGLVAGVDCSTQAVKVLVVDPSDGRVVAAAHVGHATQGTRGASETDPAAWWDGLAGALAQTGRAGHVAAISVAAQQHGLVVTDDTGRPLRPAILWNDVRSAVNVADLTAALGGAEDWAARIGVVPNASFTVSSWAWLRAEEPEVAARTVGVRLPHDWLTERLCGRAVTDRGDASGTGWWSVAEESYASEVLGLATVDLDPALLPEVLGPQEVAGTVTAAAASALGLGRDVVVGPGTGDNMGAALGLGLAPGRPVLSLGTSGTVFSVSDRRPVDASGVVAGFADASGRYLPLACTLNCTLATDRVAGWLRLDRDEIAESTNVTVLPYLAGERTPSLPHATGLVVGLTDTTTRSQILRAAYEGAVFSLLEAIEAIAQATEGLAHDTPLTLVGGGARGAAWHDVVRRLSGRGLVIPAQQELVALGAAAQAAGALQGTDPQEVAARWGAGHGEKLDPLPRDDRTLDRLRSVSERAAALLRG